MSKLIYITESQLNEIVGNGGAYLDDETTNEYRLGGPEISSDGVTGNKTDGDVKTGDPKTTDPFADALTPQDMRWRFGYYRRLIPESNQDFTGKQNTLQISKTIIDEIKKNMSHYNGSRHDQGYKRALTIIQDGRVSYDDAYRILNDFKTNKIGVILNLTSLQNELRRKLNTAKDISKNNRETKMAIGKNVLKSAPKTGAKGGAHTPKEPKDNVIGITYRD